MFLVVEWEYVAGRFGMKIKEAATRVKALRGGAE
jgi:hypothetical protein